MAWASLVITALAASHMATAHSSTKSKGCGSTTNVPVGQRVNQTLTSLNRPYMIWLPPGYSSDTPSPLIISHHGASRTSEMQANLDLLTTPEFNTDHIMVYPQALTYNGEIFWEGSPGITTDDVGYVLQILDRLEEELCVDTSRVYATGKSQGGGMVNNIACDEKASARFAAFAPVSGAYYAETPGLCDPLNALRACSPDRRDIPLLAFHGQRDQVIPFDGADKRGACLPSVPRWASDWAIRNGLPLPAADVINITSQATMSCYGSGNRTGEVRFVASGPDVDHDWPATIPNSDQMEHFSQPASFNASSIIMDFFRNHTLPDSSTDTGSDPTSTSTDPSQGTSSPTDAGDAGASTTPTTAAAASLKGLSGLEFALGFAAMAWSAL